MKSLIKLITLAILSLLLMATASACTLASPFNQLLAQADTPTPATVHTRQPTFTPTLPVTPTPTRTPTPTLTPIPTETPTPTATRTPLPTNTPTVTPTNTPAPPPPPTNTPLPTDTPLPTWDFQLAELFNSPTTANIFSIIVAIQTHEGGWVPGYRVVGIDPNGIVTKSELSADRDIGHTPADTTVIKSGNVKFEPQPRAVYIDGVWTFYLEKADGQQASEKFTIVVEVEQRQWYFFRFQPGG
jgi:hypothetical protein